MSNTAELDAEFQRCSKAIQNLPKSGAYKPTHDEQLNCYSLFKQATVGPCNIPKPAIYDFVGGMKWEAWTALAQLSKEDAKKQYVELCGKMNEKIKELKLAPEEVLQVETAVAQ